MTGPAAPAAWQQARRSPVADLIERHRAEMAEVWRRHQAELRGSHDDGRQSA